MLSPINTTQLTKRVESTVSLNADTNGAADALRRHAEVAASRERFKTDEKLPHLKSLFYRLAFARIAAVRFNAVGNSLWASRYREECHTARGLIDLEKRREKEPGTFYPGIREEIKRWAEA